MSLWGREPTFFQLLIKKDFQNGLLMPQLYDAGDMMVCFPISTRLGKGISGDQTLGLQRGVYVGSERIWIPQFPHYY